MTSGTAAAAAAPAAPALPPRPGASVTELVAAAAGGQHRAVARLVSMVEDASPRLREVAEALTPRCGRAYVVGLTGAPGVGKSTSTSALVTVLRATGARVGVIAVDPSSPFTGGALLGDRVRMREHATDPGVFIRSLASRGHLGGLSWATPQALRVLDGVGFDVVLVETVGVGQAEVDVASLADTTVVLLSPGMGDGVQAAKAGLLEVADVLVVNKADRPGADETVGDLKAMLGLSGPPRADGSWRPPVVRTVAARGEGAGDLLAAVQAHRDWLARTGGLGERRVRRAAAEIEQVAIATLRQRLGDVGSSVLLDRLAAAVVAGTVDPYTAADELVAALTPPTAAEPPPDVHRRLA